VNSWTREGVLVRGSAKDVLAAKWKLDVANATGVLAAAK